MAIEDLAREPAQLVILVEKVSLEREVMMGGWLVATAKLERMNWQESRTRHRKTTLPWDEDEEGAGQETLEKKFSREVSFSLTFPSQLRDTSTKMLARAREHPRIVGFPPFILYVLQKRQLIMESCLTGF